MNSRTGSMATCGGAEATAPPVMLCCGAVGGDGKYPGADGGPRGGAGLCSGSDIAPSGSCIGDGPRAGRPGGGAGIGGGMPAGGGPGGGPSGGPSGGGHIGGGSPAPRGSIPPWRAATRDCCAVWADCNVVGWIVNANWRSRQAAQLRWEEPSCVGSRRDRWFSGRAALLVGESREGQRFDGCALCAQNP